MKLTNVLKIGVVPFCAAALLACNNGKGGGDTPTSNKVNVTFKNYDGKILQTETIDKGGSVTYHQTDIPSKPITPSGELGNKFIGWDKSLDNITSDTVLTAQFKAIDSTYKDHDNDGIPEGVDTNDYDNNFTYSMKSMVYFDDQKININFNRFLSGDNTVYDNEIAKLGLIMSNPKADFSDGLFTDKAFGGRENALYSRLGCDDWHHFDFKDEANTYQYDPKDTTSGVYGHKYLFNEDGTVAKDLIFIAFEGTNGKNRWSSNFDVGYDDQIYYEKVKRESEEEEGTDADHPEWDNKKYHKGFYIAARRVLEDKVDGDTKEGPVKFKDYIKKHSTHGKPIVFVTGHSRGGAMANIVGNFLETEYKENDQLVCDKVFTYTFASPAVWGENSKPQATQAVFNIINSDDIVTKVPFSGWGFTRLGNDILVKSVKKEYKEKYEDNRDKRTYDCITDPDAIFNNLNCAGRHEIYQLENNDKYGSKIKLNTNSFSTKDKALGYIEAYNEIYSEKLGNFYNFIELRPYDISGEETGPWDVYAWCCVGTITALAQAAMTNDSKVLDNITDITPMILNDRFNEMLWSIVFNILGGGTDTIALPHDYGAYQVILSQYDQPEL